MSLLCTDLLLIYRSGLTTNYVNLLKWTCILPHFAVNIIVLHSASVCSLYLTGDILFVYSTDIAVDHSVYVSVTVGLQFSVLFCVFTARLCICILALVLLRAHVWFSR